MDDDESTQESQPNIESTANEASPGVFFKYDGESFLVETEDEINRFSTAFCSPDEQKTVDRDAMVVDIGGGVFSSGLVFIPGVGVPLAAIVSAGKSAVAENIRDKCRSEDERKSGATTIKGVLSEGLGVVSNAVIPGSGIAKGLLEGAANTASNLATDRAVDQIMIMDFSKAPETQGPAPLFPEDKPVLSEHQKNMMRSASEALREAVIEAGGENIGQGVSANAKGHVPDISAGNLY